MPVAHATMAADAGGDPIAGAEPAVYPITGVAAERVMTSVRSEGSTS